MEEAWELAAVSDDKSDFEDRTYTVSRNFSIAAIISVAMSVFQVSEDSSFFGVRFENTNEVYLEASCLVISLVLGLNLWLRYKSESVSIFDLSENIKNYKSKLALQLEEIVKIYDHYIHNVKQQETVDSYIESMQDFVDAGSELLPSLAADYSAVFDSSRGLWDMYQKGKEAGSDMDSWMSGQLGKPRQEILRINDEQLKFFRSFATRTDSFENAFLALPEVISNLERESDKATIRLELFSDSLCELKYEIERLDAHLVSRKDYFGYDKFRVILFMRLLPTLLALSVLLAFLFFSDASVLFLEILS